jgi:hypothetical protein
MLEQVFENSSDCDFDCNSQLMTQYTRHSRKALDSQLDEDVLAEIASAADGLSSQDAVQQLGRGRVSRRSESA